MTAPPAEHFCTLFDAKFLPLGMALHRSLMAHCPQAKLWILCLDEKVEAQLRTLALPGVSLLPLRDVEAANPALAAVKATRTWRAYCWTLSPFIHQAVLARAPEAQRVTYVDADLFFFDRLEILLDELDASGKHVLITDHAFDPRYDKSAANGRYCVQFITVDRSAAAQRVLEWWQERCLEWCHEHSENGRFGDQKYLDQWPTLFPDAVHVLRQTDKTLAPWNADHFARRAAGALRPVFFHFHSLRIVSPQRVRLFEGYVVPRAGRQFYRQYVRALAQSARELATHGIALPVLPVEEFHRGPGLRNRWRYLRSRLRVRWQHFRGEGGGMIFAPLR